MNRPAAIKNQVSSGGVIFRKTNGSVEVALVAVKDGTVWCLPKGLIDKGEETHETAVREVREETGLNGKIISELGDISYWYYIKDQNTRCRKTVHFFLMEYLSGDTADHDSEVKEAAWFPVDEALNKVSYKGDREIMAKAKEIIRREIQDA